MADQLTVDPIDLHMSSAHMDMHHTDLQTAHVFYTSLGDAKARTETAKALKRATPFFRRAIGDRMRLRRVPEVDFRFDEAIAHQDRIEQILRDLHEEEAKRNVPTDDEHNSD